MLVGVIILVSVGDTKGLIESSLEKHLFVCCPLQNSQQIEDV